MATVHVVVGGQFGSEGKGHFVAELTKQLSKQNPGTPPAIIRTGGPNAGHTAYDEQGREWKLRMVPAGAVADYRSPIALAAGCEIDLDVLSEETASLEAAGIHVANRLHVDNQATVMDSADSLAEDPNDAGSSLVARIGSTGKGIGAARARRIWREADIYGGEDHVDSLVRLWLSEGRDVILEATQGFGLGLHAGYYPYCTSRDVRAIDVLAEVGVSPWQFPLKVWVVFRPFPIRVAGQSGPLKDETTWETLGLEPEFTTVTKKMRRVGYWDGELARQAILANGGVFCRPVLMFADHIWADAAGETEGFSISQMKDSIPYKLMEADIGLPFEAYGTGPQTMVWNYLP